MGNQVACVWWLVPVFKLCWASLKDCACHVESIWGPEFSHTKIKESLFSGHSLEMAPFCNHESHNITLKSSSACGCSPRWHSSDY